jgi:hypothetical protein
VVMSSIAMDYLRLGRKKLECLGERTSAPLLPPPYS